MNVTKIITQLPEGMIPLILGLQLISGDFDGDGKTETLRAVILRDSILALVPDKRGMDTFFVSPTMKAKRFLYLQNTGDLNGDGAQEFSFVPDAADYSNINTCFIISLQNGRWICWYDFEVMETGLKKTLVKKVGNGRIRIWRYNPDTGEMEPVTVTPETIPMEEPLHQNPHLAAASDLTKIVSENERYGLPHEKHLTDPIW